MNSLKDDASYKYHENEGVIGWILLSLRLEPGVMSCITYCDHVFLHVLQMTG